MATEWETLRLAFRLLHEDAERVHKIVTAADTTDATRALMFSLLAAGAREAASHGRYLAVASFEASGGLS
jgi:hypothetical protein